MTKITREDIQRIGDEDTLLHFLQEKLDLPIKEGTTLGQIASPMLSPFLGLDDAIANQIIDCHEFRGICIDTLGARTPLLIRFRREQNYEEILRKVAEGLSQKKINPGEICFICAIECFQPFALAYFNGSTSKDWNTEVLTVFTWTQGNTRINAGVEHNLQLSFPLRKFSAKSDDKSEIEKTPPDYVGKSNPEDLLTKLLNVGTPLGVLIRPGDIHTGITPGYMRAFEIDEFTCKQLRNDDPKSVELIKPFLKPRTWTGESAHVICIPSSKHKSWPWTGRNESEAERIFESTYPAISAHMKSHRNKLENRSCFPRSALFYWELPAYGFYAKLKCPKIFYPPTTSTMQASYDTSGKLLFSAAFFSTTDLSLLAILNSKLFAWYVHQKCWDLKYKHLGLEKSKMKNAPIAGRAEEQKAKLSGLVQQILDDPYNFEVPDIEHRIDELVYELYQLGLTQHRFISQETSVVDKGIQKVIRV